VASSRLTFYSLMRSAIVAESNGSGFPLLDRCYTPDPTLRVHKHYTHYVKPLIPEAVEKLLSGKSLPRKARRSRQSYATWPATPPIADGKALCRALHA
jgi:hypothetical protein